MKVAISGSHGLVGSALASRLTEGGHEVIALERKHLYGSPENLSSYLEGVKAVVHLAGKSIQSRWTAKNKKVIYDSRIQTTRHLVDAITMMKSRPEVFICASAATIYPEEGVHTEKSSKIAPSFLGYVASSWENEAARAKTLCRTLFFRMGMVISANGGALKTMLPPFRLWVGGKVGSGKQMVSWIHLEDVVEAVIFAINTRELSGVVNIVSPNPVTNAVFSRVLAKTIRRPSWNRVPPALLYLLYGKGARVVVRGVEVLPEKLRQAGFKFRFPRLEEALAEELS